MPRRKVIEEEPEEKFEWDKTRIVGFFASVFLLIVGIILVKHFVFDAQNAPATQQAAQGISTQDMSLPSVKQVQQGAQEEIGNLAEQASKISVQDIASSSPQVQQILQEIKQLPNVPGDVAKQTCEQLCGKL